MECSEQKHFQKPACGSSSHPASVQVISLTPCVTRAHWGLSRGGLPLSRISHSSVTRSGRNSLLPLWLPRPSAAGTQYCVGRGFRKQSLPRQVECSVKPLLVISCVLKSRKSSNKYKNKPKIDSTYITEIFISWNASLYLLLYLSIVHS